MYEYIKTSDELKDFFRVLDTDKRYSQTRQRCNDYMHYNYFDNVMINDNKVCYDRIKFLDLFKTDLENLFILHACAIFYLNDHYMGSMDYLDYLAMGMTPPEDSEYWVAYFIQEIFSEFINEKRPDLVSIIKVKTYMFLS